MKNFFLLGIILLLGAAFYLDAKIVFSQAVVSPPPSIAPAAPNVAPSAPSTSAPAAPAPLPSSSTPTAPADTSSAPGTAISTPVAEVTTHNVPAGGKMISTPSATPATGIVNVVVNSPTSIPDVTVTVVPATVTQAPGIVYKASDISISGFSGETAITFSVEKSWAETHGVENIRLAHQKENTWDILETQKTGETGTEYTFSSTVESFSLFAIIALEEVKITEEPKSIQSPIWGWILIGVLVLFLIIMTFMYFDLPPFAKLKQKIVVVKTNKKS